MFNKKLLYRSTDNIPNGYYIPSDFEKNLIDYANKGWTERSEPDHVGVRHESMWTYVNKETPKNYRFYYAVSYEQTYVSYGKTKSYFIRAEA